ncbi:MAG: response regulator transcription factor [Magnetococcales bacterium]|nr:response regulator transcription factor [Magnetococcales bacterium]
MIKIFITDDHPLMRAGIQSIVEEESDLSVVGESSDGKETLQRLRNEAVDVLLLDLQIPNLDGFEVLQRLKELRPELAVLILTSCGEESIAYRCLQAGASGYLVKDSVPAELVKAIRAVRNGRRYLSSEMAAKMAYRIGKPSATPLHETLTNREFQVLRLLVAGMAGTEIAQALRLSPSTVSTYRLRIFEKLEISSLAALVLYAVDHNLVGVPVRLE